MVAVRNTEPIRWGVEGCLMPPGPQRGRTLTGEQALAAIAELPLS